MIAELVNFAAAAFAVSILLWIPFRGTALGRFFGRAAALAAVLFFLPAVIASILGTTPGTGEGCSSSLAVVGVVLSIVAYIFLRVRALLAGPASPPTIRSKRAFKTRNDDSFLDDLASRVRDRGDA